jgi:glucosamine-6-phosphate deaminase
MVVRGFPFISESGSDPVKQTRRLPASEPTETRRSTVKVHIFPDDNAMARAVALRVMKLVAAKPAAVLGLPTGRTPVRLYAHLRALAAAGKLDFSRVTTFNLDEFHGLPATHPASYRSFMEEHLFAHVNINRRRIHFLDGMDGDASRECSRYESAIADAGGIDLQILGIGTNGHIGFNEPAAALQSSTHLARLKPETRRSNANLFGGRVTAVPREALSMGVGTIMRACAVILMANGTGKADAVKETVEGPVTTRMPASLLQLHRQVELILDEAAAAKLRARVR